MVTLRTSVDSGGIKRSLQQLKVAENSCVIQADGRTWLGASLLLVVLQSLSRAWLCVTPRSSVPRLLCPWHFPDKNTGVGCHFFFQGIFLMLGSNPHLLHCRRILYHWAPQGIPSLLATAEQTMPFAFSDCALNFLFLDGGQSTWWSQKSKLRHGCSSLLGGGLLLETNVWLRKGKRGEG